MPETKLLVGCPNCQLNGKRQILGEIKDGFFWVMRFHNGFTKIRGEFEVLCNTCGELVYFRTLGERRNNDTNSNFRINRFYRSTFGSQTREIGTGNIHYSQGSIF